jgi:hypothetical protein
MFHIEKWILALVIILAMMLPFAALAQDTATEPAPTEETVVTSTVEPIIVEPPPPDPVTEEPGDPPATSPENLLGQLFSLLKDSTYMVWAAAGVLVIVGLIKTLASTAGIVVEGSAAVIITLIVQVLIWLTYSIANAAGQGAAYQEWYNRVIDFVRALLPLAGAIYVANWGYHKAAAAKTPIVGFKAVKKDKAAA